MILARGIVDVEHDQVGASVGVDVGYGDSSALVLPAEPARHLNCIAPTTGHVALCIQVPTDAIVAVIGTPWVVDVEYDQVRTTVAVDVGYGDSPTLILRAEPTRHLDGVGPTAAHVTVCIQVPADAVITVVRARGIVDVEYDQVRTTVAVDVGYGNPSTLILRAEPTRHLDGVGPTAAHVTVCIQVPADAVITVVLARGIVDVEYDQVRTTISVDVGHGDASALVLRAEPARHLDGVGPTAAHVTVCIQVPADAVITVVRARGIVDVEYDQVRTTVAVDVGY